MIKLRTTPKRLQERDYEVFPALDQARRASGCPDYYSISVGPLRVRIKVDAFFVSQDVQDRLHQLYLDYGMWWLKKGNPARRHAPRPFFLPTFHDWTELIVLREHAMWWIELFNESATLTYNTWEVGFERCQAEWAGQIH